MARPLIRIGLLVSLLCGAAGPAGAAEPVSCEENVKAWAERCPALAHQCLFAELCPPRAVILSIGCDPAQRMKVEVAASPHGFRKVGELSVSPIIDSPDWQAESPQKHQSFEALAACVAADQSIIPTAAPASKGASHLGVPWLMLGGLTILGVLLVRRRSEFQAREVGALLLLGIACFLFRKGLVPTAFFHQNGQGPFWVAFALEETGTSSPYGTAYWEIFSRLARRPHDPETPIYLVQSTLGALVPLLAWLTWRGTAARRWLVWGAAIAVALNPIQGRLAQSESYFATATFLLFAAAATLALGFTESRPSARWMALAAVGAGLLISEEARLHQVTWTAAAFVPFVILAGSDSLRRTIPRTLAATLTIGLLVLILCGHAMLAALKGELARHWLPIAIERVQHVPITAYVGLGVLVATILLSRERGRAFLLGLALVATLTVMEATRLISEERTTVNHAYLLLWTPPVVALVIALVAGVRERLNAALATALLVGLLTIDASTWRVDTMLATDSIEAEWAREWRKHVPDGATVVYVGLTSSTARDLPLYGHGTVVPVERWVLTAGRPAPMPAQLPTKDIFYYESSLCLSPEAGDTCRQMHERFQLEPIVTRVVPGIESSEGDRLLKAEIPIGLYRIVGPRS